MRKYEHVNYYYLNIHNKGVRKEHLDSNKIVIEYDVDSSQSSRHRMLYVSHPCLCGSLNHSRTNHQDCLLNTKFMDAIEWILILNIDQSIIISSNKNKSIYIIINNIFIIEIIDRSMYL